MLLLKTLKFCNVGRFISEQTIDFRGLDRLIEVGGFNKNTGGSSGAGKSTIFHAFDYLLGINDIPATGLQSRLVKDGIYVEGVFDCDGKEFIIRRSKKDGLYVKYGDEEVSGNVKLAEERLDEIIGIPRKLFKKMVHKKQKEGGFFLNFTAKESYEFLMKVLGLEQITEKTNKIDEDIKSYVKRIQELNLAISAFVESIDELEQIQDMNKQPVCDITNEHIEESKKSLGYYQKEKDDLNIEKNLELNKHSKPEKPTFTIEEDPEIKVLEDSLKLLEEEKRQAILSHSSEKKTAQDAYDVVSRKIQEIPFHKQKMDRLIEEMKSLMEQRKHIESQACPTCNQTWIGDSAESKIKSIVADIENKKTGILTVKELVDQEEDLKQKLSRVKTILDGIDSKYPLDDFHKKENGLKQRLIEIKATQQGKKSQIENQYLTDLNKYNETIKTIENEFNIKIKASEEKIAFFDKQYNYQKYQLETHQYQLSEFEQKKKKLDETIQNKKNNLIDANKQLEENKYRLSVAEESKRAIKTYSLQIFQETLDYIGNYATEILSEIPNMTNATIYFEGCKENKTGSIKDEVNAIINMDGHNDVNIKTLSGGERTAIDLAVDLAVIDIIESKAGKGTDFFILDEPFEGLEEINITQCLEVLRQVDTNKKIIIVDHNPIAKEMINDRIMVERTGEESVVL